MGLTDDNNNNDDEGPRQWGKHSESGSDSEGEQVLAPPDWVLDCLSNSGVLYWRMERPGAKVKFRCDVQVLEFLKENTRYGRNGGGNVYDPWREDTVRCRVEELPPPSPLLGAFCLAAIIAILGYQWAL